ncbi:MAG TPA: HEAT repeat domain-containing protein [Vicinamibacterales bacterium]|nr:HEAT repeat domain-containing protein [Vicinamibacterales bacterium]
MTELERFVVLMFRIELAVALVTMLAVVVERAGFACWWGWRQRTDRRYGSLVRSALEGDEAATRALIASPGRHRLTLAALLILPLIDDRNPDRIARTRTIVTTLSLVPIADRFLRSRFWWRRALALRALGLTQIRDRTAAIVAALDDKNASVRAAALDALTDLKDPASLQAVVIRLHDRSLHRGRRIAAITAFGNACEPFLLDLAEIDPVHRSDYARALAGCGSERARPTLCQWAGDTRGEVRAAAFEALAHLGLDGHAARLAIDALESEHESVREMAAFALRHWGGPGEAATCLGRHLEDTWTVALRAAQSLKTMGPAGLLELQAHAHRQDIAGDLARQMLWEQRPQC